MQLKDLNMEVVFILSMNGSEHNEFNVSKKESNFSSSGGILRRHGEAIYFNVAFKPVSTSS